MARAPLPWIAESAAANSVTTVAKNAMMKSRSNTLMVASLVQTTLYYREVATACAIQHKRGLLQLTTGRFSCYAPPCRLTDQEDSMFQQTAGRGPNGSKEEVGGGRPCMWTSLIVLGAAVAGGMWQPAVAATLCVNPAGSSGCFSTIGAAVAAASIHDHINVAAGTYKEDVIIGKALSLSGMNPSNTVIDATGLSNGIYIDGIDNPGLHNVVVTGFTIENANFEGILLTNTSYSLVYGNRVINNDKSLNIASDMCPGQPSFETSEGDDCGEGIHLIGVDHSTIANNLSQAIRAGFCLRTKPYQPTATSLAATRW